MENIQGTQQYKISYNGGVFILNGTDPNNKIMIEDFQANPENLEYFTSLLNNNPQTAWNVYYDLPIPEPSVEE